MQSPRASAREIGCARCAESIVETLNAHAGALHGHPSRADSHTAQDDTQQRFDGPVTWHSGAPLRQQRGALTSCWTAAGSMAAVAVLSPCTLTQALYECTMQDVRGMTTRALPGTQQTDNEPAAALQTEPLHQDHRRPILAESML